MSDTITVRVCGADRQPLTERFDLELVTHPQKVTLLHSMNLTGPIAMAGLSPVQTYEIRVTPRRHRAVSRFVATTGDVDLYAPILPRCVSDVHWSDASRVPLQITNHADTLTNTERAGLANIYAKMAAADLWRYVITVTDVHGDRIFATVEPALRDAVANSPAFESVSGALHDPPPAFEPAGSYKERGVGYGVLQVTLFSNGRGFRADIDIDDAGGLGHVFQVLDHALTHGATHPYDIHQILTFHQWIDPGYTLVV